MRTSFPFPLFVALVALLSFFATPVFSLPSSSKTRHEHHRAAFIATGISSFGASSIMVQQKPAFALENTNPRTVVTKASAASTATDDTNGSTQSTMNTIIYHPLSINVDGVQVPVAAWHPSMEEDNTQMNSNFSYEHRISVSKIGKSLAGWNLPSFVDRNFFLQPNTSLGGFNAIQIAASSNQQQQQQQSLPQSAPVVLLAHGYLGSRFDLSHLGEAWPPKGFWYLPRNIQRVWQHPMTTTGIPIDRTIITKQLLGTLTGEWNVQPRAYGIVGHSLGCGTVDRTGDATWTRVCLAGGYPSVRGPNCLFIGSINDGAVSVNRAVAALREYNFAMLNEQMVRSKSWDKKLPSRSSLIFTNPSNAPNHISFLAEGTNDAMVEFLSPLLPLARILGIPVLDFDKYQMSRDSKATGDVVIPLVVDYLKQMMSVS